MSQRAGRGGIDLLAGGGGEFVLASSGMVVMSAFSATSSQKKRPMGFELGMAAPATGRGREASPHTKGLHQVDDKGNRHPEVRRSPAARMAFICVTKKPAHADLQANTASASRITSSRKRITSPLRSS